jgi:succinate dehydrogenase / fumarate reductase, cytochrome b subunit
LASAVAEGGAPRSIGLYQTVVGKKFVMAISGIVLYGFVVGHLAGNLQVYLPNGEAAINNYAKFLKSLGGALWAVRGVLLLAVLAHIYSAFSLWSRNRAARPQAYAVKKTKRTGWAAYASRTMYLSGPILLCFIVYHLLHFTTGTVHGQFVEGEVYRNLVTGFQNPLASGFYILSMLMLGYHLVHGVWSMFGSLGFSHPEYQSHLRLLATASAAGLMLGNISIPVSVLLGIIR